MGAGSRGARGGCWALTPAPLHRGGRDRRGGRGARCGAAGWLQHRQRPQLLQPPRPLVLTALSLRTRCHVGPGLWGGIGCLVHPYPGRLSGAERSAGRVAPGPALHSKAPLGAEEALADSLAPVGMRQGCVQWTQGSAHPPPTPPDAATG